jgi:hypothetical protein
MRRVLSLVFVAALALTPACYLELRSDGYLWACDDQIPFGTGVVTACYPTSVYLLR